VDLATHLVAVLIEEPKNHLKSQQSKLNFVFCWEEKTGEPAWRENLSEQSRKEGVLGFSVLAVSLISFSFFVPQKTSAFRFWWLLRFLFYLALGFRFSVFGKIKIRFSDLLFECSLVFFFGFPLGKYAPLTTSTACTSSLILLADFGFDRNLFRFCGFLLLFVRFCGFLRIPMPPSRSDKLNTLRASRPKVRLIGARQMLSPSNQSCSKPPALLPPLLRSLWPSSSSSRWTFLA